MSWLQQLRIEDLRVLHRVDIELGPGLNVFSGSNAQGKTSVLEAVALLARGRSFRTDDLATLIRRGEQRTVASGRAERKTGPTALAVEVSPAGRRLARDGRVVSLNEYHGQIEAAVYGTDRLRIIRGGMRERRLWIDRNASALDSAYRHLCHGYERTLRQRNAALDRRSNDLDEWDESLVVLGSRLRTARSDYARKLNEALERSVRPSNERYAIAVSAATADPERASESLRAELVRLRPAELSARRTLAGPHRDSINLIIDGEDAARFASSGQSRTLLLALTLAVLAVHEQETGEPAIALLDDLDSELDDERASRICEVIAARGQALVTTAHPAWARSICTDGRLFSVSSGDVRAA